MIIIDNQNNLYLFLEFIVLCRYKIANSYKT